MLICKGESCEIDEIACTPSPLYIYLIMQLKLTARGAKVYYDAIRDHISGWDIRGDQSGYYDSLSFDSSRYAKCTPHVH